ncbi:uncharacterized protein LOC123890194 [Trifolium pratense]|uniref:uncharacterized protein LOC123890194 n=1 Tax=Trifolium pratense TaxID=57577 RepID=UPI001E692776|nr:uncharacterized protein LOC123890194 [Trifolium pratense]
MRIKSEYLDISGKELWKLRSYNDEYVFLLQDVKIHDEGVVELEVDEKCLFMEFSRKLSCRLCLMHIACPRAASFFFCSCLGRTSKMPCRDRLGLETLFASGA